MTRSVIRHPSSVIGGDRQLGPDDPREVGGLRGCGEAHRAAQVIVVGERERGEPQFHRALHEALRVGSAVEQREGGVAMQLGVHGP